MSTVKKIVFATLAVTVLAACNIDQLEFDNLKIEPITGIYALPLGNIRYTMRQLIEEEGDSELELVEDSTSLLTFFYRDTISYAIDNEFVNIPDIVQSSTIAVPTVPVTEPRTQIITSPPLSLNYEAEGGEELDSVFYSTGDISIVTTSTIDGVINYSYEIVNTKTVNGNQPMVISGTLDNNVSTTDTRQQSLVGYKTTLGANNEFTINFSATATLGATDSWSNNEEILFEITYANQTFSIVYGKFGQDTVQVGSQVLDITFFDNFGEEGLAFGNPTMKFDFENEFGIPIAMDFSQISGSDGNGGTRTYLKGSITENLPEIAGADPSNPGTPVQSLIEINKGNSSIVGLFGTSPNRLRFDIKGISNLNDPNQVNFVQPGNKIEGTVEIEIPLTIRLENLEKKLYYSLGDGLDTDNVDSAFVRINTKNELPFSGTLQLEIQDADSNALYTADEQIVLNAPFININGFVTDPSGSTEDIALSPAGVEALATGAFLVLNVSLSTPTSQTSRDIFVKVLADYALEINVGVGGRVNIDL